MMIMKNGAIAKMIKGTFVDFSILPPILYRLAGFKKLIMAHLSLHYQLHRRLFY